jgi:hypothetical protein
MVSRVAVTTGAPAASAFSPTLPAHVAGDRLTLFVVGKYDTTTVPTINQGWLLVKSGTGGTGSAANDTGITFWAVYQKDVLFGVAANSDTAPTVTPGGTAPNSWEWVCVSHRPDTGKGWVDQIAATAAWVQSASDTTTATPLTGTCGAWTGVQPTAGDAIFAVGVIPTDLGTALGTTTLTATGLSGGTLDTTTTNYIENSVGQDTAAVWADWVGFTGTASAGLAVSMAVTGASNLSGSIIGVAIREHATTATTFDAELGSSGATVTQATFPAVGPPTIGGGSTFTHSATDRMYGAKAYKYVVASTFQDLARGTIGSGKAQRFRGSLKWNSGTGRPILNLRNTTPAVACRFLIDGSNRIVLHNFSGTTVLTGPALTSGVEYDISLQLHAGVSTSLGAAILKVYERGTTTQVGSTVSTTAANFGAVGINAVDLGTNDNVAGALDYVWDNARFENDVFTEFDPIEDITGTIAATGPEHTSASAATAQVTGTISAVGPAHTAAGAGTSDAAGETGTIAAVGPAHTASGTGTTRITGTSAAIGPQPTTTGSGSLSVTGSASATSPNPTTSGAGQVSVTGSGAATSPAHTADGAGSAYVTGTGAAVGPAHTASAGGQVGSTATGAVTAVGPQPTTSGAGSLQVSGIGAGTGPAHTAQAAASSTIGGLGSAVAPAHAALAEMVAWVTGAIAADAPAHTAALIGIAGELRNITMTASLGQRGIGVAIGEPNGITASLGQRTLTASLS